MDSAAVIPPRRQSGPVAPELADYFRDQLAGHYIADRHLGSLRIDNLPLPVDMELMKTVKQLYESVPWDPI